MSSLNWQARVLDRNTSIPHKPPTVSGRDLTRAFAASSRCWGKGNRLKWWFFSCIKTLYILIDLKIFFHLFVKYALAKNYFTLFIEHLVYYVLPLTLCCIAWPKSNIWPKFRFKIRKDEQKISYERRVYESVDDNSLSKVIFQKTDEKNKSCNKGLNKMIFF